MNALERIPRATGKSGGVAGTSEYRQGDFNALLCDYKAAGLFLVPIPKVNGKPTKGPTGKGWNLPRTEENPNGYTDDPAIWRQCLDRGDNLGLAHLPSGTIALDIDDMPETLRLFDAAGLPIRDWLDDPNAVMIQSGKPGRGKLIYRLPVGFSLETHQLSWKIDGKEKSIFELRHRAKTGATVQDVMPPSIHPDTGKQYTLIGDITNIPEIPPELLAMWDNWQEWAGFFATLSPGYEPPKAAPRAASAGKPPLSGQRDAIAEFNETHSLQSILEQYGYKRTGRRFIRPGSDSGIPGLVLLGDETCYSHGADVLNDGYRHDAFDLYRLLECGGDWKTANEWNPELTAHNRRLFNEANRRERAVPAMPDGPARDTHETATPEWFAGTKETIRSAQEAIDEIPPPDNHHEPRLDREATDLLASFADGGIPAFWTNNLRKIAVNNGYEDAGGDLNNFIAWLTAAAQQQEPPPWLSDGPPPLDDDHEPMRDQGERVDMRPLNPPREKSKKHNPPIPPTPGELKFTPGELDAARLTPPCIVREYLYADVATIFAPGGTGKTTQLIHESVCIALGLDVWGLPVEKTGWTLIVTAEDSREIFAARLREILRHMDLTDRQRLLAIENVRVWDVRGLDVKLIHASDGNLKLTDLADSIVKAYQDDPPIMVVFDPLISFGVDENRVNDNEQALVTAGRRIVRGLGCCTRLIHHTGKANAENKQLHQYAGRGGSALSDGARMVTVLQLWDDNQKEPLPQGCTTGDGVSVTALARAKLSYSKPNLPLIFIRRQHYQFEHFTQAPKKTKVELSSAHEDQLERFLTSEVGQCRHHNKKTLEEISDTLDMTRAEIRKALTSLVLSGRIVDTPLPANLRQGRKQTFLCPANIAERFGDIEKNTGENDTTGDPISPTQSISPPVRDRNGGDIEAAFFSPLTSIPPRGFGDIGENEEHKKPVM